MSIRSCPIDLNFYYVDYLNRYRIGKAKDLLESSRHGVKVVGFLVGFSSVQSFIRTFKKFEGVTPGKFGNRLEPNE